MTWIDIVGALPTVTLAELNETAELLTRVDRKYVVPPEALERLLAGREEHLRALEIDGARCSLYRSVYYDTPELASYLAAARKRPRRFKVRTREYLDTGTSAVEVKLRSPRGGTVKHRAWLDASVGASSEGLGGGSKLPEVIAYASSFAEVNPFAAQLRPCLTTTYERTTLLVPAGRVTIDAAVSAEDARGETFTYGDALIVETKTLGGASPLDRDLWAMGLRPQRLSKYATSLAALHPDLPSNRWHRTLTRHAHNNHATLAA